MYIDKLLTVTGASGQAVTASAVSTDSIDLKTAGLDPAAGTPVEVIVTCLVAMTDDSSDSTIAVTVITDSAAGLDSTPATICTLGTFAALSAAGTQVRGFLPQVSTYERYLGIQFTAANGNLTTGTFEAVFHPYGADSIKKDYPDGFTIQ